ncbi:MAG: YraN family protein [Prolixibacteraceae bacterium]|nr:YraN family protein [Prolixibacteraceae bacterium]MBN2648307.1 YraN family protein [Prolixibacteraceae bacterium]
MAQHNDLGQKGEELAFLHLVQKGYKILERNWRYDHAEIDIIARIKNVLVIVEVKTRSAAIYEEPRETISDRKIRFLVNAAEAYIEEKNIDFETRFDVVAIKWFGENKYELNHIEDAFTPLVN